MQTLALIVIATAAMQTGSSQVYGPPPPMVRTTPGYSPSVPRTAPAVLSDIRDGRDTGELTRGQAKQLRRELGEIDTLEQRFSQNGLSNDERAEIQNRVEVLRAIANAKRAGAIK